MSRRCNGGAGKIARHLWFQLVRQSGFSDNVVPARSVLNLLYLLNQVSVVTIHITRLMRHMALCCGCAGAGGIVGSAVGLCLHSAGGIGIARQGEGVQGGTGGGDGE